MELTLEEKDRIARYVSYLGEGQPRQKKVDDFTTIAQLAEGVNELDMLLTRGTGGTAQEPTIGNNYHFLLADTYPPEMWR